MSHSKALSPFSGESTLKTLLIGGSAYITPYVIDVSDVVDNATYSFWINSTVIEIDSEADATKKSILVGLKNVINAEASGTVVATIFEDEEEDAGTDAANRLRIVQEGLVNPFVVSSLSGNLEATQPVYIALYTQASDDSISELTANEGGYHRVKGTWAEPTEILDPDDASVVTGTQIKLGSDVMFGPAGEEWGQITHYGVYDQLENGNLLIEGPISVPKNVLENDFYLFREGDLVIKLK